MLVIDPYQRLENAFHAWKPPEMLSLSEWADKKAYLSPESSSEPGRWRSYGYQPGIMDAFTDPMVEMITLQKCARVGYTKILNWAIGYYIEHDPCSQLVVQPTIDDAQGYSKEEIAPMIRDVPCIHDLVSESKSRDSDNTILKKKYPGGYLHLIGANSARGFRRITVRNVYFDEVDGYPPTAGHEGDQIKLGIKRTETAWNRKIAIGSTPTIKGVSRVENSFELSDQRFCFVGCPHCREKQYLKFKFLKWKEDPLKAWYECEHCGSKIDHRYKRDMLASCEWMATKPFTGHAGFFIWAAYSMSPNSTWGKIAKRFADAKHEFDNKGDDTALRTVINTDLAETYEEKGEQVAIELITGKGEQFEKDVLPEKALVITVGADIQKDRIEAEVVAWGLGCESWSLEYHVIEAETDTSDIDDLCWLELGDLLEKTWNHPDGILLHVAAAGIDCGYATKAVESFVRPRQINHVYAVKGSSTAWQPIAGKPSKKSVKKGFFIYPVGTDTAKSLFYARLQKKKPGPGFCHFPETYGENYFKMLTAEELKTKYQKGVAIRYFALKRGVRRNEALDCRVYNTAALEILNPNWKAIERNVRRRITRLKREHAEKDKIKNKTTQPKPTRPIRKSRRKPGFVKGYRRW